MIPAPSVAGEGSAEAGGWSRQEFLGDVGLLWLGGGRVGRQMQAMMRPIIEQIRQVLDRKLDEITLTAKRVVEFYRIMGGHIIMPAVSTLPPVWKSRDCDFTVTAENGRFRAIGSHERKNALGGYGSLHYSSWHHPATNRAHYD